MSGVIQWNKQSNKRNVDVEGQAKKERNFRILSVVRLYGDGCR